MGFRLVIFDRSKPLASAFEFLFLFSLFFFSQAPARLSPQHAPPLVSIIIIIVIAIIIITNYYYSNKNNSHPIDFFQTELS
jgi:hypothetical protein